MTHEITDLTCHICDMLRPVADLTDVFGFPMCRDRDACHQAYLDAMGWSQDDYDAALQVQPYFPLYGGDDE